YTMDCTLTAFLSGQSRTKQVLWFKVAARSAAGRGPLSTAISQRCSSPPSAPQNLTMNTTVFDSSGATGSMYVVWEEPADLHEAVLLGYKVYVDDGNSLDTKDIFYLAEVESLPAMSQQVIDDPERRVFRQDHIVPSRAYKQRGLYKVTAITEVGEGKALCPYPQRYQLAVASVDVREDADITSPLFPFVTVTQGTILE
ncbi:Map3k2, partial [Symbiodinium necroappetens]